MQGINPQAFNLLKPSLDAVPARFKDRLTDLFDRWEVVRQRNMLLSMYYDMKAQLKDMGISIPEQFLKVNCVVGWCKKAIDAHSVRSIFDGYAFAGAKDAALDALVRENGLSSLYRQVNRGSLVHGLSAMTIMKGTGSQPEAKARGFSGNQFSATWDKDAGRVGCGVVVTDVDKKGQATRYVAHFPDAVLVLERQDIGQSRQTWTCQELRNDLGQPLMVLFPHDPDLDRPLGHSLITPELQGIVDKAMRDVFRMAVGAEFFTFPQRYVLGAAEDLFSDGVPSDAEEAEDEVEGDGEGNKVHQSSDYAKFKAYIGAFLAISRDENGDIPQVGQFAASPAENFTAVFENDAQRFSGATNVPLSQLGVLSNTYTSSDALSATNDPLILEVEETNRHNDGPMTEVAKLMMAIDAGVPVPRLPADKLAVQTVWIDPSMPTLASRADAWTKLAAADPSIVGTRLYYEKVGLTQSEIDRLMREKLTNGAISQLASIADKMGASDGR